MPRRLISLKRLDAWIEHLQGGMKLNEKQVKLLCNVVTPILHEENNVVNLTAPVTVCGDIHGQFSDLLKIFQMVGKCPEIKYLFLGDYIDRGSQSVETISLLFLLKARYPDSITLLRGNHECRRLTKIYGFYAECLEKYGNPNVWTYFTNAFDYLPLAALVDRKVFCVHGGISPHVLSVFYMRQLHRFKEIPSEGPMCDLLWADPTRRYGFHPSPRGVSFKFGPDATQRFIQGNHLSMICRAHQVVDGFEWKHDCKIASLFSAPDYCGYYGNRGAVLQLNPISELERFIVFPPYTANPLLPVDVKTNTDDDKKK